MRASGWSNNFHTNIEFSGEGTALLSVREHQSRIAIRLADGSSKGNVARDVGPKVTPKAGDVVIKLAGPILAGSDCFNVVESDAPATSKLLSGAKGDAWADGWLR